MCPFFAYITVVNSHFSFIYQPLFFCLFCLSLHLVQLKLFITTFRLYFKDVSIVADFDSILFLNYLKMTMHENFIRSYGRLLMSVVILVFVSINGFSQNLPPVVNLGVPNQHAEVGSSFSYTIPSNAFRDENGDALTLSVSGLPNGLSFSGTRSISGKPVSDGNSIISVVASDGQSSVSTSFTLYVHAEDSKYAAFTANVSQGCGGSLRVSFTNKSKGASSYSWILGNGNTSSLENPSALYKDPGTYTVTLALDSSNSSITFTDYITIYPLPSSSAVVSGLSQGCEPFDLMFLARSSKSSVSGYLINGQSVGGVSGGDISYYTWYFNNNKFPLQKTTENQLSLEDVPGGSYSLYLTTVDKNGCSNQSAAVRFQASYKPLASFTYEKTDGCNPSVVNFKNTSKVSGANIASSTWFVNGVKVGETTDLSYEFTSTGKYEVKLVVSSDLECDSDPYIDTVTFNAGNKVDFSVETTCAGDTVVFDSEASSSIVSYAWDFNDDETVDSNLPDPKFVYGATGEKTPVLFASFNDGCELSVSKSLNIDGVKADFDQTTEVSCLPYVILFNDKSTSAFSQISSRKWFLSMNGGTETLAGTGSSLKHTFSQHGIFVVRLEVVNSNGCTDSYSERVDLSAPSILVYVAGRTFGCADVDEKTTCSVNMSNTGEVAQSYSWNFGDGSFPVSAGQSVDHVYPGAGSFSPKVTITTDRGCSYEATGREVRFANPPEISLSDVRESECYSTLVEVKNTYSPGTDSLSITVDGEQLKIKELQTSDSSVYAFDAKKVGTYKITSVAVDNGCPSSDTAKIELNVVGPRADFIASQLTFCENGPYTVSFTNKSDTIGIDSNYKWSFGKDDDVSTSTNPEYVYDTTGNYPVVLIVEGENGCSDTISQTVNIFSFSKTPGIIQANSESGCYPMSATFGQKIQDYLSENYVISTYKWDLNGDSIFDSYEESPSFTYEEPGLYTVSLMVTNGYCDYSFEDPDFISVGGPLVTMKVPDVICNGYDTKFGIDVSKADSDNADTCLYSWNFGDGNISTEEYPSNKYVIDSTFMVKVEVTDNNKCSKSDSVEIKIDTLVSKFEVSDIVCAGEVRFENKSIGKIENSYWDFDGDGIYDDTTNVRDVLHTYTKRGFYTPKLKIVGENGCERIFEKTIRVTISEADFTVGLNSSAYEATFNEDSGFYSLGCAAKTPYFETLIPDSCKEDVAGYSWDFGDDNTSNDESPENYYRLPGYYTVTLTTSFLGGCSYTETKDRYVYLDGAYGVFNYDKTAGCAPNEVKFTVSEISQVEYITWDFANGETLIDSVEGTDSEKDASYVYTAYGNVLPYVQLYHNTCGNYTYSNEDLGLIYTSTPPVANFEPTYKNVCQGVDITFYDRSQSTDPNFDVDTWTWNFSDGNTSTQQTPVHSFDAYGSHSVSLISTTTAGCSDTVVVDDFIIYPKDQIYSHFELDDYLVCDGQQVSFLDSSKSNNGDIVSWKWNFGDGVTSTVKSPVHSYSIDDNSENYTLPITLSVVDDKLCEDSITKNIDINNLQASIEYGPQPVYCGGLVSFSDLSSTDFGTEITDYEWSFNSGNPSNSTSKNVDVRFPNIMGLETATLIVENDNNCRDTAVVNFSINNNPPLLNSFEISFLNGESYEFATSDFSNNFDANDIGQNMVSVRIAEMPDNAALYYRGELQTVSFTIPSGEISNLSVESMGSVCRTYMLWNASDGIDYAESPDTVWINIEPYPDPATITDIVINVLKDSVVTITRDMFEDNFSNTGFWQILRITELKIVDVPTDKGLLSINGQNITDGQTIDSVDIDPVKGLIFEPMHGFGGQVKIEWTAADRYNPASGTAFITINYINTPPIIENIVRLNLPEDDAQIVTVDEFRSKFSDVDIYDEPQILYLHDIPSVVEGVLKINGSRLYSGDQINFNSLQNVEFEPAPGFDGTVSLEWIVSDGMDRDTALMTFSFVNASPIVHSLELNGKEDETLIFDENSFSEKYPDGPFEDIDVNDVLDSVMLLSLPDNGILIYGVDTVSNILNLSNEHISDVTFIPDADWFGLSWLLYKGFDGTDWSENIDTVFLKIAPVNDAPVAVADTFYMNEDEILSGVNVLANDYDIDNDISELSVSLRFLSTAGGNGILSLQSDGSFTYQPNLNYSGSVSFSYYVYDKENLRSYVSVLIVVAPVNDTPVAADDYFSIWEDEKKTDLGNILDNDSDIDGDKLILYSVGSDTSKVAIGRYGFINWISDGEISYVMNDLVDTLRLGQNVVDVFTYSVVDESGSMSNSNIYIEIKGMNDEPFAVDDTIHVSEDVVLSTNFFSDGGFLLSNDFDLDKDDISVISFGGQDKSPIEAMFSTLKWNSIGNIIYQRTVTYLSDHPNFTELDTLAQGMSLHDSIQYIIIDTLESYSSAWLHIFLDGENDAPVAIPDSNIIYEDQRSISSINSLFENDYDVDKNDVIYLNMSILRIGGTYGHLELSLDGSYVYVLNLNDLSTDTLAAGEEVYDVFEYRIRDIRRASASSSLKIKIVGVNDSPVAVNDSLYLSEDDTFAEFNILDNDYDVDQDSIFVVEVAGSMSENITGRYGTLVWSSSGLSEYYPRKEIVDSLRLGMSVVEEFEYKMSDANGATAIASIVVNIGGENDAPEFYTDGIFHIISEKDSFVVVDTDDSLSMLSPYIIGDVDDDMLSVVSVNNSDFLVAYDHYGELLWNPDGSYTFVNYLDSTVFLALGDTVNVVFAFAVADKEGAAASSHIVISIVGVNDPPVAKSVRYRTLECNVIQEKPEGGNHILHNDYDVDSKYIKITEVDKISNYRRLGKYGILDWANDGGFEYSPDSAFAIALRQDQEVVDSFGYTLADDCMAVDSALIYVEIAGLNNVPIADNDTIIVTDSKTVVTISSPGLLSRAKDLDDGDTIRISEIAGTTSSIDVRFNGETYGQIVWDETGMVEFVPNTEQIEKLGPDQKIEIPYNFVVEDNYGGKGDAQLILMIMGMNSPLTAVDDYYEINEDSYLLENPTLNDIDLDNDGEGNYDFSTLTVFSDPLYGTAVANTATGEIFYRPDENFVGIDSFMYRICDTGNSCDEAWIFVTVLPVNDLPVGLDTVITVFVGESVSFDPIERVSDIDDGIDPASLDITVSVPQKGTVSLESDKIRYTSSQTSGTFDEFVYSYSDFSGAKAYVIVSVNILHDTLSMFVQDDYVVTNEDEAISFDVLANDTIAGFEPYPMSFSIKVYPQNGFILVDSSDNKLSYVPFDDFYGADKLVYTICSNDGICDVAEVFITVNPVNDHIEARDDASYTLPRISINIPILYNDVDPDGYIDTSSVVILESSENCTVLFNETTGDVEFLAPELGRYEVKYRVCDNDSVATSCDTAIVTVLVSAQYPQLAENDNYETQKNQSVILENPHPTDNDVVNGEKSVDPSTFEVVQSPINGTYSSSGNLYEPQVDFWGIDIMRYIVGDFDGNWDMADINVWVAPSNNVPIANDDYFSVVENRENRMLVLGNDYDTDGYLVQSSLSLVNLPSRGIATVDILTGSILYKPTVNKGSDTFTYSICDDNGACSQATVSIVIDLGSDMKEKIVTYEDVSDTIDLVAVMADYNISADISRLDTIDAPSNGSIYLIDNGKGLVYSPKENFYGADYFCIKLVSDDFPNIKLTVDVTVLPVNDAPIAFDDTVTWTGNTLELNYEVLLNNDFDVDGDTLLLSPYPLSRGFDALNVVFTEDERTIRISTDSMQWCNAWFVYQIKDPDGLSSSAYVRIFPVLDGVDAIYDEVSVFENSENNKIDVLINDIFKDNQRCVIDTIEVLQGPYFGNATTSDEFVVYTPNAQYYGYDSLLYRIVDIWGQNDSAWVYINVEQKNTPPVAVNDNVELIFGEKMRIPFLDNDYDPDEYPYGYIDTARSRIVVEPVLGTAVFDAETGVFVYRLVEESCDADQFTYVIFDNEGDSSIATVTITPPTDAPLMAMNDTIHGYPGIKVVVDPLANDSGFFIQNVSSYSNPFYGSVFVNAEGYMEYTPDGGFVGRDSISYTIESPCGNASSAYVIFVIDKLRVPEIITPNGDGKNDVLIIDGIEYYPESVFEVYNRYGHIVYSQRGYDNSWGGFSNRGSLGGDKPLPSGTYYYVLVYNNGQNRQAGFIYVFR